LRKKISYAGAEHLFAKLKNLFGFLQDSCAINRIGFALFRLLSDFGGGATMKAWESSRSFTKSSE
jgi:hypothetical protein